MAKDCIDILKDASPQLHKYLEGKAGVYDRSAASKQAYRNAASELQNETLNNLQNVYNKIGLKGFESPIVKQAEPQQVEVVSNEGKTEAKSETPIKDEYGSRVDNLDQESKQSDVANLGEGDYVNVPKTDKSSGVTGFVKKMGRTNVVLDTFYQLGSTADDGIMQEITVKKSDIKEFYKPKPNEQNKPTQQPEVVSNEVQDRFGILPKLKRREINTTDGLMDGIKAEEVYTALDLRNKPTVERNDLYEKIRAISKKTKFVKPNGDIAGEIDVVDWNRLNDLLRNEKPNEQNKPTQVSEQTKVTQPDTTEVGKVGEAAEKGTAFSQKARALAASIRTGGLRAALPDWAKADLPEGTQQAGFGGKSLDEAVARAIELVADAVDAGKAFADAIKQGFAHLKDYYTKNTKSFDEKKVREQFTANMNRLFEGEPPKVPPPTKDKAATKEFSNEPKSILNRINESENIGEQTKKTFEQKGLRYNPQSHETARALAQEIIDEFGVDNSISMAESNRFDGDVNSMIFAEGIDRTFEAEQSASSQKDKIKFAQQWADYAIRYDEAARQKGRFISAIYDFYKKSPLGVILSERAKRDEAFKDWFTKREKSFKEVFDAIKDEPEFKELVKEKVEAQLKSERTVYRMKRRNRINEIFDSAKIKGDQLSSSIIPPPIWNSAVEVMKQAALAGESIVSIIETGVAYIKKNHSDGWDEKAFRDQWNERLATLDGRAVKTDEETLKNKQEKILERFRKKLSGLNEHQKEDVIRKSFKTLVESGALEYDDFKKIVADVIGLGELTPEETQRLTGFVKDLNAVQDLSDKVLEKGSKEALMEFEAGVKKAEQSAKKLAGMLYNKPKIAQRVRSIIQLNTLGIVSLIKNPFYNIFHQALVRFPKAVFMTAIDQSIYGISLLGNKMGFGNPIIKPDVNILLAQKGYFGKGAEGGAQSVKQLFTGLTNKDYFQKEIYNSQIKPFQSWRDLWDWGRGNRNLTKGQIADKAIQATVGIPAEMVARMLNIGDKPFRYAAEAAIAETIATQEFGLKGIEREIFLRLPREKSKELYLKKGFSTDQANEKSEAIEKRIISEGEQAVFQQNNVISDVITGIKQLLSGGDETSHPLSKFGAGAAKLFGLLNMPFVKTPVNIAWEVFNLVNPEFALFQSFAYGVKAAKTGSREDFLKAKKWMAHAATGWALLALTGYLASIGAASGDDEDEPYKEKEVKGKGTFEKPRRINYSKVWRAVTGGSLEDQDGDVMVDLSWHGAFGMIMNMQANKYENMTKEQRENMAYVDDLIFRLRAGATEGLTNSVFQGTLTAVDALRTGRTDQWLMGMLNVGANFIQPATLAQISRATRPYDYQLKADNFPDNLKNSIRARFFGKTTPKVNIWGDTIKRDGSPGDVALRMLGIGTYDKDVFGEPIHQDFKRTGNADFYPPALSNEFSEEGKKISLNAEQFLEFETLVGQARKSLIAPFVNDYGTVNGSSYSTLPDDGKLDELRKLYSEGRENGKKEFLILHPELLNQ